MSSDGYALSLEGISKHFGPTVALDNVDLALRPGHVHAVLGANGSGKSTLVKVLSGYHAPERGGRVWIWGREAGFPMASAEESGIAVIHQDLGLLEDATVLENIEVGARYGAAGLRRIGWKTARKRSAGALAKLGSRVALHEKVSSLEPAERTTVAIARAVRILETHPSARHVLVLDEPTVTFPPQEVEALYGIMRDVARGGGSIMFITHRLHEALGIADHITVLRDGRVVMRRPRVGLTPEELVQAMVGGAAGRPVSERHSPKERGAGGPALRINRLTGGSVRNVSFTARKGEIVGITGLGGMGQDHLPYLVIGAGAYQGLVEVDGRPTRMSPRRAWKCGVVLVPANRHLQSIWRDGTMSENFTIARLRRYYWRGFLRRGRETAATQEAAERFDVRPPLPDYKMRHLSGGNQQKTVLARALACKPLALLLHEPVIGVDVAGRSAVVRMIDDARSDGAAVVIFSTEYELLSDLCDRIVILKHGMVVSELTGAPLSVETITKACHV